ncbi:hypothetical protein ACFL27_26325, partial [candidate division CSSED10-310 bacterium]
ISVPGFSHQDYQGRITHTEIAPTLMKIVSLTVPESCGGIPIPVTPGGFKEMTRTVYFEIRWFLEMRGILADGYKLIARPNKKKLLKSKALFNLETDPSEKANLRKTERAKVQKLFLKLQDFYSQSDYVQDTIKLDQETRENLKQLGYIN